MYLQAENLPVHSFSVRKINNNSNDEEDDDNNNDCECSLIVNYMASLTRLFA